MKKRKMHKAPSVISVDLKSHKSRVIQANMSQQAYDNC